ALPADCTDRDLARNLLRAGFSSVAGLFILQLQDLLELGNDARINRPGSDQGNWRWRLAAGQFGAAEVKKLAHLTRLYGRRGQGNNDGE
ncbi:MAG: 4-alpha-glucanotransferase, partial [Firmicutes bacterium]|nr:4-alpha-glucanotransferase [Bacillota bacterium]